MYASTFPASPVIDAYLCSGRIIEPGETGQDMVNRVVTALAAADTRFDPQWARVFADRLGRAMDTARVVFSSPIMTNVGRYPDRPPVDLRGDLAAAKAVVDDYHRAGMGPGSTGDVPIDLDALADTTAIPVRALDDAIEASLAQYPDPLSAHVMGVKRKIGVGVCGLADLLLATEVLASVNYTSKLTWMQLAHARGATPAIHSGLFRYAAPGFLERFAALPVHTVTTREWVALAHEIAITGMLRNSSTIAVPPTGRSAPVVGASTGIEPLFRLTDPHVPGLLHPKAL